MAKPRSNKKNRTKKTEIDSLKSKLDLINDSAWLLRTFPPYNCRYLHSFSCYSLVLPLEVELPKWAFCSAVRFCCIVVVSVSGSVFFKKLSLLDTDCLFRLASDSISNLEIMGVLSISELLLSCCCATVLTSRVGNKIDTSGLIRVF
jgi:hypothetical protein